MAVVEEAAEEGRPPFEARASLRSLSASTAEPFWPGRAGRLLLELLLLPFVSVRRDDSPGRVGRAEEEEDEAPLEVVVEVGVDALASSAPRAPGRVGSPFGPVGTALEEAFVEAEGRVEDDDEALAVSDFEGASDLVATGDDAFDGAGVAAGVAAGVVFGSGAGLLIQCFRRFEMTALYLFVQGRNQRQSSRER